MFVDECHFTGLTMLTHAYSTKGNNISLDNKKLNAVSMTLIAAVSKEHGLEAFLVYNTQVDS